VYVLGVELSGNSRFSVQLVVGSAHHQQPGKNVDEDAPDPRGHGVGLGGSEVNVEDHDGDAYAATEGVVMVMGRSKAYLNVSRIIVKSTNLPKRGTTREVGGMISAKSRKNTVSDKRMEIDKLT
jgi:hypothetical protein